LLNPNLDRKNLFAHTLHPTLAAHHLLDNVLTQFQAQLAQLLQSWGQRMWLDLLVASGIGLPAIVYGSVLFVNYMQ
jgi:phospholipase/lecithinase/hemolysin